MFLVPLYVPFQLTAEGVEFQGPKRCGIPEYFGICGSDLAGENVWIAAFEWPEQHITFSGKAAGRKRQNEERQLARLRSDFVAGGSRDPITQATFNEDESPDFVCDFTDGQRSIGVELTQLTLAERAMDQALFTRLRARVLRAHPERFRTVNGNLVVVAFTLPDGRPRRPTPRQDEEQFITALSKFEPPPPTTDPLPEQLDMRHVHQFVGGSITAMPLTEAPTGLFFEHMGFELGLAQSTLIRGGEAWQTFVQRVVNHDDPGVDLLVVSAGSPVTSGVAFPFDGVLARAVLAHATDEALTTDHIARVWVHAWSERAVYELIPGVVGASTLCGRTA